MASSTTGNANAVTNLRESGTSPATASLYNALHKFQPLPHEALCHAVAAREHQPDVESVLAAACRVRSATAAPRECRARDQRS
jgi:hypothetical protein